MGEDFARLRFAGRVLAIGGLAVAALALVALAPALALAEASVGIDPDTPPPIGAGWDVEREIVRSAPGICMRGEPGGVEPVQETRFSLLLLSRAGGRLVLGLHAARLTGTQVLESPLLTDAARRLHRADPAAFDDMCGKAFVLGWVHGVDYAAELEVARTDAARAAAWLERTRGFGTWQDTETLSEIGKTLLERYAITARELPHGSRRNAQSIEPAVAFERALALAEPPSDAAPVPFVAVLGAYTMPALSGVRVPWSGTLPDRVAEAVFSRGRRGGFIARGR